MPPTTCKLTVGPTFARQLHTTAPSFELPVAQEESVAESSGASTDASVADGKLQPCCVVQLLSGIWLHGVSVPVQDGVGPDQKQPNCRPQSVGPSAPQAASVPAHVVVPVDHAQPARLQALRARAALQGAGEPEHVYVVDSQVHPLLAHKVEYVGTPL